MPGKSHGWKSLVAAAHVVACLENPRDGGAWWAAIYGVAHPPITPPTSQPQRSSSRPKPCRGQSSLVLGLLLDTSTAGSRSLPVTCVSLCHLSAFKDTRQVLVRGVWCFSEIWVGILTSCSSPETWSHFASHRRVVPASERTHHTCACLCVHGHLVSACTVSLKNWN